MSNLKAVSENVVKGKCNEVKRLVQSLLNEKIVVSKIINEGLIDKAPDVQEVE